MTKSRFQVIPSWFALAKVLSTSDTNSASDTNNDGADPALSFGINSFGNLALPTDGGQMARGSQFVSGTHSIANSGAWTAGSGEGSASRAFVSSEGAAEASATAGSATGAPVTIANGAKVEIDGPSGQSVTFAGTTGTLKLQDAVLFAGVISGLSGADAIDLSGFAYGANVTASYVGNATGGALTVTDGAKTAKISLSGDYLSSGWSLASDGKGGTTLVDPTWQDLKVGGGGFVRGLDIAPNGVMVGRTDTNGAYLWNGSSWVQLVTASSMPAAFGFTGGGVYEIQIADSNTNIFYMQYDGYIFKSTNQGTTWTQTAFSQQTADNANDSYGQVGQKMAIDPNNPNIVYAGTETAGMFVTTNGGATWTSVSAVPVGSGAGITGILFDPAVGGVVNGATQTIFASSNGHGVYESTNGGATWTALTGGPSDVEYAAVSSTGVYYAVGDSGSGLWSYASGKWTQLLSVGSGTLQSVAVDPANSNEVVVETPGGGINISYNGGTTWSNWYTANPVSTDIPWETNANSSLNGSDGTYMDVGGLAFNPLVANQIIVSGGTGVWNASVPTSGTTDGWSTAETFNDMSVGIENLVATEIIAPPGGNPILASWDRPFFEITNPNAYPSTYGPVNSDQIVAGWSVDYASSSPSFIVGLADWWGVEESGYSTNGGQTWTKFPTMIPGADSAFMGGTIAASTPQNIIWAPANKQQPYYTLNGGSTWSPITLPGVTSWSGFDWAYYLDQRSVTADRVLANTFYLYYAGQGVFSTTNGGASWTKVYSGYIGPSWAEGFNSTIESVPGEASNLFYTGGPQGTPTSTPAAEPFYRSTNGGATWTAVSNVQDVFAFGFGAAAPGQSYPAIYIAGYVNNVYGVWQSTNNAQSWTNIGTYPVGELDQINTISGDPNHYGQVYVGFAGGGYAYLPAAGASTTPSVTGVNASPATGTEVAGDTITFTVTMSEAVTVAGGKPTLTLNDGGKATYASGSGTSTLTFTYTVGSTDSSVSSLAITAVSLPSGVTIHDSSGNAANMAGAVKSFSGLSVDLPVGSPVTVAYYLANKAGLDAAGNIAISDTAANVSGNIAALNGDADVTSITLTGTGTPTLALNVAQALDDTRALGAIKNASYAIAVTDTAANISANFDALNADTHVTSIAPSGGGTQTLTLTVAQALNDTRALSILDPFTITVTGSAASLQALTAAQIANLSGAGVTLLEASGADVTLTVAQKQALGAGGIAIEELRTGGGVKMLNYSTSGALSTVEYLGIVGAAYTSYTVTYEANGEPASASYSNGMTAAWTYNANGSYHVAFAGVTGAAYTSYTVQHASNGEPESASYSNGMTAAWTFNVDGSYDINYAGVTGQAYSSYEVLRNNAGAKAAVHENMTNGLGDLLLYADGITINSSAASFSVTTGADTFSLNAHAPEAISAAGLGFETFRYAPGFGESTIASLVVGGGSSDVIQLRLSMFHGLSSSNTAAQNLAELFSTGEAAQSGSNVTFADKSGDVLTLANVTTAALSQNANAVFKFV